MNGKIFNPKRSPPIFQSVGAWSMEYPSSAHKSITIDTLIYAPSALEPGAANPAASF
jgi:hypothetical protein